MAAWLTAKEAAAFPMLVSSVGLPLSFYALVYDRYLNNNDVVVAAASKDKYLNADL